MLSTKQITEYAASLFGRRHESANLAWADISIGDWKPMQNQCHENVTTWCTYNTGYEPIRGWLYFDFENKLDYVQFVAHSAVRAPDSMLYDITPAQASQQYPFISANLSETEYATLVEMQGIVNLRHFK